MYYSLFLFIPGYELINVIFLMAHGLAHVSNMENIYDEVQRVCSGTSYRFVLEPSQKYVQAKLLISIIRFKNLVQWK